MPSRFGLLSLTFPNSPSELHANSPVLLTANAVPWSVVRGNALAYISTINLLGEVLTDMNAKRVAIYTRVSKDDGSQDNGNQLHELQEFATRQGWNIVQEFVDEVSGGKADRTQFKAMMTFGSKRKCDVVLFWALDRFSREGVRATIRYMEQLESWGVAIRSYTEPYIDSTGPFSDMLVAILATFAALERVKISDRTKAGLARARREGKVLGGRPVVDDAKLLELRAAKVSVRQIARETGWSLRSVMRHLQQLKQAA